jgi:hypothetical protein
MDWQPFIAAFRKYVPATLDGRAYTHSGRLHLVLSSSTGPAIETELTEEYVREHGFGRDGRVRPHWMMFRLIAGMRGIMPPGYPRGRLAPIQRNAKFIGPR